MCDYLDNNRSVFAFRRAVPKELQPFILTKTGKPRTEWRFSLKTTDRKSAEASCRIEAVLTDQIIDRARARLLSAEINSLKSSSQLDAERAAWDDQMEAIERSSQDAMRDAWELDDREPLRRKLLADLNKPRSQLSSQQIAMRELIPDAEFDPPAIQLARQRAFKELWDEGAAEVARSLAASSTAAAKPLYPSIKLMFADYAAEGSLKPATRKRWTPVISRLVAFVGHDDAARVTKQDAVAWKDNLLNEKDAQGQRIRVAVTVREVFLACAKATFTWGVTNGRLLENPFASVSVKVQKRQRLRDPDFTDEEALRILRAARLPQTGKLAPEHALARRWVPWIGQRPHALASAAAALAQGLTQRPEGFAESADASMFLALGSLLQSASANSSAYRFGGYDVPMLKISETAYWEHEARSRASADAILSSLGT